MHVEILFYKTLLSINKENVIANYIYSMVIKMIYGSSVNLLHLTVAFSCLQFNFYGRAFLIPLDGCFFFSILDRLHM